jgi:hypothetical protein
VSFRKVYSLFEVLLLGGLVSSSLHQTHMPSLQIIIRPENNKLCKTILGESNTGVRVNRNAIILAVVLTCVVVASTSTVLVIYNPLAVYVSTSDKSSCVFDVDLSYAFTGRTNATGKGDDHFGWGIETYPSDYYPVTAILNLTYLGNPQNEPYDVICEGYFVNFFRRH